MESRSEFPFAESDLFNALIGLITPLGIQASSDKLFKGAIFGRDSLRVGFDLVPWLRSLSETILFSLAHFQATEARPIADAKRAGQIPHEVRLLFVGPRKVAKRQQELLNELAGRWGGTSSGVVQYGSADATPQFVRLVARHCHYHGPDILDEVVLRADGATLTLRECVFAAVRWTEDEIQASGGKLLGFVRANKEYGHRWQIIQDGATSIIHPDGRVANADACVETIGLQGLAYDCLVEGAHLLERDTPSDASRWRALASDVRNATMAAFWMSEEVYFASAIDRDPTDGISPRTVQTLSSIPTELLETGIFEELPESERRQYISGIIRMAHGPEFMTPAGIRSRALRHASLLPYADYHGSQSCWGISNSLYAAGLERQGFGELARILATSHIHALAATEGIHEFLYVDPEGHVRYPLLAPVPGMPENEVLYGTNHPETNQAWTLSFVLRSLLQQKSPRSGPGMKTTWQRDLEREIIAQGSRPELRLHVAYLDTAEAHAREDHAVKRGYSGTLE